MFEKKYGIKSRDTRSVGTEGHRFRTPWMAALWCTYFEFVEWRAGVDSEGWVVEEYVPKGSKKWKKLMNLEG